MKAGRDENVTLVRAVTPTAPRFARYLVLRDSVSACARSKRSTPKHLWKMQIVTLGSVPGITTRYRPALHALYGPMAIHVTYGGATECVFSQQRDERQASRTRPNYDLVFVEVETRTGVKMLHEIRPEETGSMIASTPVLPRYRIGDLIRASLALSVSECVQRPYLRCIGRDAS